MNQKGFINILLVVIIVLLAGAGVYFASTRQITPSIPTTSPSPTPTPTPKPSPTPTPTARSSTSNTKDISGLSFAVGTNAELLVIDPNLKRTGFDSAVSKDIEDIPNSAYFRDSLSDDVTGEPSKETSHQLNINQPTAGIYQVYLIGLESGDYQVSIRAFSQDGSSQPSIVINGQTQKGLTTKYQLQYQKSVGAISKLLPSTQ